jgi:hypothetical protein
LLSVFAPFAKAFGFFVVASCHGGEELFAESVDAHGFGRFGMWFGFGASG